MAAGVMGHAAIVVPTPLGELIVVASQDGVLATMFDDEGAFPELDRLEARLGSPIRRSGRGLASVGRQVESYFRGTRRSFTVPVDLSIGPAGFGRLVLRATMAIPFGELATYGDVAAAAGRLRAGRAAGNALSRSPIELFVPCHRVVHAGGTIGGYGRHEDRKRWLLRHEGSL